MPATTTTSAKRTIVIAMTLTAGVVFLGNGADTSAGPAQLVAATIVAVMLAFLAEVAPQLAAAFAVVILVSAWLDKGAGFTKALEALTKRKAT